MAVSVPSGMAMDPSWKRKAPGTSASRSAPVVMIPMGEKPASRSPLSRGHVNATTLAATASRAAPLAAAA